MAADVSLDIDINKKGDGDKAAAAGLELVAKSADHTKDQLAQLDRKLLETRAAMVAAGKTFTETGDISPLKSLIKDERQLQTVVKAISRGAESIKADLIKAGDDGGKGFFGGIEKAFRDFTGIGLKAGEEAGKGVSAGLQGTLSTPTLGPAVGGALVAAIVASAPAIGAAASAAILLGIGGGTLAGGIALAVKDPAVRQAWAGMADQAKAGLTDAASVFQEPLIASARIFEQAWGDVLPGIRADFAVLAPTVEQLATGAAGFVRALQPGWDAAVRAAVPLFDQLGRDLPALGAAIGDFFRQISAGGPGATTFLHDFIRYTGAAVEATGFLIGNLSKVYLVTSALADLWAGNPAGAIKLWAQFGEQSATAWHGAGDAAAGATGAFGAANTALQANAVTVSTMLKPAFDAFFTSSMGVDQAVLGMQTSLSGLTASVRTNGRSLDITTAAGQANAQALYAGVQAAERHRQAMLDSGKSAAYADEQYRKDIDSLYATAGQAHLTGGEVDKLIGKYRDMPGSKSTSILTPGLLDAISNASSLDSVLRGIPSEKRVSVITTYYADHPENNYRSVGSTVVAKALGGIVAAAQGMIVNSPTVLFGERQTGLEAYIPKLGIPDARGLALADTAARWHGGMVVPRGDHGGYGGAPSGGGGGGTTYIINNYVTAGVGDANAIADEVGRLVQKFVLSRGGSAQEALGRRGS